MEDVWGRLVCFLLENKLLHRSIVISFKYDLENKLHSYVLEVKE